LANAGGTPAGTGNTPGTGNVSSGNGGTTPTGYGGTPGTGNVPGGGGSLGTGGSPPGGGGVGPTSGGAGPGTGGGSPMGGAGGSSGGAGGAATGGTGGMSGGGGTGGDGTDEGKPPCLKDSTQIVLIGDSYINWGTHTFPADINAASMLTIQDFAVGGTSMGSGGIGLIPPQFDTALQSHPNILAVIMDGGGNDVLLPDAAMFPNGAQCKNMGAQSPMIADCQKIVQKALDAGQALFLHMADKGVQDAIFFYYPHVPLGTLLGGTDPNGMLDYAQPKIKAMCDGAYQTSTAKNPMKPIRCHFVPLVPVFDGHMEYFASGDVHPNPMGSKAMAAAVWAKAKADCVAQPASSGCCTPQ
jgi:hypothetical protein